MTITAHICNYRDRHGHLLELLSRSNIQPLGHDETDSVALKEEGSTRRATSLAWVKIGNSGRAYAVEAFKTER